MLAIERDRVDLPDPLGPTTATASPALSAKLTSLTTGPEEPGGVTATFSTARLLLGASSVTDSSGTGGFSASSVARRPQACRAPMKPRQLAMAWSTGASARPARIDDAKMMPAEALPSITRMAPTVSTADWMNNRRPRLSALYLATKRDNPAC